MILQFTITRANLFLILFLDSWNWYICFDLEVIIVFAGYLSRAYYQDSIDLCNFNIRIKVVNIFCYNFKNNVCEMRARNQMQTKIQFIQKKQCHYISIIKTAMERLANEN